MYLLDYSVTFSQLYTLFTHYLYINDMIMACLSLRIANVIVDQRNIYKFIYVFYVTGVSEIAYIIYCICGTVFLK